MTENGRLQTGFAEVKGSPSARIEIPAQEPE